MTDAEAEAPILFGHLMQTANFRKDPDAGKDWRQEKGAIEDKMVGWHHRLYGCEFEQALGVGDGQGSLVCCSPWRVTKSQILLSDWAAWSEEELSPPVNNQYQPSIWVSHLGSWFHSLSQVFRWELPRLTSFFLKIFWLHHAAYGILGPQPGFEPVAPALAAQSLNHWRTREVLRQLTSRLHLRRDLDPEPLS